MASLKLGSFGLEETVMGISNVVSTRQCVKTVLSRTRQLHQVTKSIFIAA